ncbi:MAG: alkaline phosphatase family protein [Streptosporangiaceae bacterium]
MFDLRSRLRGTPAAVRYGTLAAATALCAAVLVPAAANASPAAPARLSQPGGQAVSPRLGHVFIIMLENHEADHVIGDPSAPYITSLAREYGVATRYYGVTHTSEPNYIAATSGSTWWNNDDDGWYTGNHYPDPKIAGNHYPHTNIVSQMEARRIPWDAYMQAMPTSGYLPDSWPTTSGVSPLYVSKHNPFILYNDVRSNPQWRDHIRPYQAMAADLNGPNPPRYVWISPDICNDMHGGVTTKIKGFPETPCPYSNVAGDHNDELLKAKADAFVKQAVHTITSSRAWTGHSVIFVTADESDYDGSDAADNYYLSTAGCCDSPYLPAGDPEISPTWPGGLYGGGSAPMIVVSRDDPQHATDATPSNHYSMLLTIEEGFGLSELGYTSDASQVHPLWPLIVGHS